MSDFKGLSLQGKVAIVTGASRGLGAGIAELLGKRGANVVVNYVSESSRERAEKVVQTIETNGTKAILCQADVSKLADIPKLVESALKISPSGKIDILIHNAAQGNEANLVDTTPEFYDRHFDTNVKGPIFLTKAVEPYLPKGGRIVFISSAGARLGVAGQTVYAATKAANEALARVWAKELGQSHGITVNSVNPGPIATDQWFQSDEQFLKDMQPLIESTPAAARVGEVDDIAPLVAFLCSEDAKWTTGSTLSANGGLYN
ncbi:L-xylulose reductase 1 [Colletotrichum truncatum]|uniref:L-xylulose reductase 1 n=1 Tax=Colletotrichum truncatum TaxID=5467 RepID=A0ACC3Z3F5_COLTU|nr:L-xylulose reductase 1 [Colletotrichum truncatum]XP_036585431.1 L-xylulose reductase 1 [Colletotrichum truncatum]KAF6780686.1 L-xylulose reductase 1 [Colletotrichum truncatum]KAF6795482.1 L-xylulose reductase 1 [Colletotrichum truncatum]